MSDELDAIPWRPIGRVTAAALLFFIAFGALLPVFPLWVAQYAPSNTGVGIATTLSVGLGLIVARPIAARMMEGRRRAPTLITGAVLASVVSLSFPYLSDFWLIAVLRGVHGLGFGLVTTAAMSAITDLAPATRRGQVMGVYGAVASVALLVGPALGATMWRHYGAMGLFGLCAAGCLLSALSVVALTEPPKEEVVGRIRITDALAVPGMKALVGAHFLAILLHGGLLTFLPARMEAHEGWMTPELFYAIDAVVVIAIRLGVGKRFDSIDRRAFTRVGLVALAVAGALTGLGESDASYLAAGALYGVGFGLYMPMVMALVGDVVPPSHRARGFALFMLSFDLSLAFGGVVVGPVADALSVGMALLIASLFPLLAVGLHLTPAVEPDAA